MSAEVLLRAISLSPLSLEQVERRASDLRMFLASLNREVVDAALVGQGQPDFLKREREEMHSCREFPHVVVPVLSERECFAKGVLTVVDGGSDHFFSASGHDGSPLIVASESMSGGASSARPVGLRPSAVLCPDSRVRRRGTFYQKRKQEARGGNHGHEHKRLGGQSVSSNIVPFNFEDHQVRVVMINDEPWFVLADLCAILDLPQVSRVKARLDDALTRSNPITDSMGRAQNATIVSEPGMYEVVIRSDKPEAAAFRRWMTGTVLPEIRKTGSYSVRKELSEQQIVLQALTILKSNNEALEAKVAEDAPKVAYVDTYVADTDLRLFRNVAKSLGITEGDLRAGLLAKRWVYAESMTRWSESKGEKEVVTRYSAYADKSAYFQPVPSHMAPRFRGEVMHTLKITPAGAEAIARLFGSRASEIEAA